VRYDRVPTEPILGDVKRWELAWLLGDVSDETLSKYANLGVLVPTKRHGVYDGDATIRAFARYHIELYQRKRGPIDGKDPAETKHSIQQASLRLAEVRLAAEEGKLIAMTDVQDAWTTVVNMIRAGILAIPGRCALELPHWEEQPHDRQVVEREIADFLNGISEQAPKAA
jgi:phage terminase Nu1 subunit (DNA packaging protein)